MSHQQQVESEKYRNWVKGGLAFKYFRDGIEQVADTVVTAEHGSLLQRLGLSAGQPCGTCNLSKLNPGHKSQPGRICPLGQKNCNCLHPRGKLSCTNKICDKLYDEIVKNHVSCSPYWKNADITKWCTHPWEVAKCYINTSGYGSKSKVADMDVTAILQVFINSSMYNQTLAPHTKHKLSQIQKRRNSLYHSSTMELEDIELNTLVRDVVDILNDISIQQTPNAKANIQNLSKLMKEDFVITTDTEAKSCREAIRVIVQKTEELKDNIGDAKEDINAKYRQMVEDLQTEKAKGIDSLLTEHKRVMEEFKKEQQKATDLFKKDEKQISDLRITQESMQAQVSLLGERIATLINRMAISEHMFLENRSNILAIKQRLDMVEVEIETLTTLHSQAKQHLDGLKERQQLQSRLKDLYLRKYVKTSICPLRIEEDTCDIDNVYVTPKILDKSQKELENYHSIFSEGSKRIYLVGDVGSGKSALCKMIISDWCKSDESALSRFQFLFYIPLQAVKKMTCIKEMIQWYYGVTDEKLNNIFQTIPDRCLVLMDGLDEWKHMNPELQREHETVGLPVDEGLEDVVILTMSRPSAPGIINLKASDCDLKVRLDGVREIKAMVDKYSLGQISSNDILSCQKEFNLKHLEKTPLLLQQIIWLRNNGYEIGQSLSEVNTNMLNVALRWNKKNSVCSETSSKYSHLAFPKQFENYPAFNDHRAVILSLGMMAFDLLTKGLSVSFGSVYLKNFGVNKALLASTLQTGLLTEEIRPNPMIENTQLTFTHISFMEYLAAVYISSDIKTTESSATNAGDVLHYDNALSAFKQRRGTLNGSLQLQNALVMVCGLSPSLTFDVCKMLYDIAQRDAEFHNERKTYHSDCSVNQFYWGFNKYVGLATEYEELIVRCARECELNDPAYVTPVPLLDVVVSKYSFTKERNVAENFRYIDSSTVQNLVCFLSFDEVPVFENLQLLSLRSIWATKTQLSLLAEYITCTVKLKHIYLNEIGSEEKRKVTIDLSQNDQMQTVVLTNSPAVSLCQINPLNFEHCNVSCDDIHVEPVTFSDTDCSKLTVMKISSILFSCDNMTSFLACIMWSVNLRHINLTKVSCEQHKDDPHDIDLFRLNQLQHVVIKNADFIRFINVITTNLEDCWVSCKANFLDPVTFQSTVCSVLTKLKMESVTLSCDLMAKFAVCVMHSVNLREIYLFRVSCDEHQTGSHDIDLSRHHLKNVVVNYSDNVRLQSVSTTNLTNCFLRCHIGLVEPVTFNATDCSDLAVITMTSVTLSCDNMSTLVLVLTRSENLRQVYLAKILCSEHKNGTHDIDLYRHANLWQVTVNDAENVRFCNVSTTRLEECCVSCNTDFVDPVTFCNSDTSELTNIEIESITLSCENMASFAACVLRSVKLRNITLSGLSCCKHKDGEHDVDLSYHDRLQVFRMTDTHNIRFHNINTMNLEKICVSCNTDLMDPVTFCNTGVSKLTNLEIESITLSCEHMASFAACVMRSVKLKNITLSGLSCCKHNYSEHDVDLSHHDLLQVFRVTDTHNIRFHNINTMNLDKVCVSCNTDLMDPVTFCNTGSSKLTNIEIESVTVSCKCMTSFVACVMRSVKLRNVTVSKLTCYEHTGGIHDIDLSRHDRLQVVRLSDTGNVRLQNVNTDILEEVYLLRNSNLLDPATFCKSDFLKLTHIEIDSISLTCEHMTAFVECIRRSVMLRNFFVNRLTCYEHKDGVHDVDLFQHGQLQTVRVIDTLKIHFHGVNIKTLEES